MCGADDPHARDRITMSPPLACLVHHCAMQKRADGKGRGNSLGKELRPGCRSLLPHFQFAGAWHDRGMLAPLLHAPHHAMSDDDLLNAHVEYLYSICWWVSVTQR
jgi:hypothetical protein